MWAHGESLETICRDSHQLHLKQLIVHSLYQAKINHPLYEKDQLLLMIDKEAFVLTTSLPFYTCIISLS